MVQRKDIRTRGKLQLSRFFQKLEKGDFVSIVKNVSVKANFPARLQGKTGVVEESRGEPYIVRIREGKKEKKFLIEPIHLKKWKD